MKIALWLCYLFITKVLYSQDIQIKDKWSKLPIAHVKVYNLKRELISVSDNEGKIDTHGEEIVYLKSNTHLDSLVKIQRLKSKTIFLSPRIYRLQEVTIKDTLSPIKRLIEALYKTNSLFVRDTVVFYSFSISQKIQQLNWSESLNGVLKIEYLNDKINYLLCDFQYSKKEINHDIYRKILTGLYLNSNFGNYVKRTRKNIKKKFSNKYFISKHKNLYLIDFLYGPTRYGYFFDSIIRSIKITGYIDAHLYIKDYSFNKFLNYKIYHNKYLLDSCHQTTNYKIIYRDDTMEVQSEQFFKQIIDSCSTCKACKNLKFHQNLHLSTMIRNIEPVQHSGMK